MEALQRYSVAIAALSIVVAGAVSIQGPTVTRGAALVAGVVAMVVLDLFPVSFRRGVHSRMYTSAVEIGLAFVATWSSPRVVVAAVGIAAVPVLLDVRLQLWRRVLSSANNLLGGAVAAIVLHSESGVPASVTVVVAATAAYAFCTAVVAGVVGVKVGGEPVEMRVPVLLVTYVAFGIGCGILGWVAATALAQPAPGPGAAVAALGLIVAVCVSMSRRAERFDQLQSTVRALSELGTVDDLQRLRHHLELHASALLRGATRLVLVEGERVGADSAPVPRQEGLWLVAERHPVADPLMAEERERLRAIAALVADSMDRASRLDEARTAATTDPLTGALNRRGLSTILDALTATAAIVVLDMDKLKVINDRGGHHVGDAAIVAVASRLRERVRASDHVARTGGDEFVVVMPHTTPAQAASVIEAAMDPPPAVELDGAPHPVTATWGVELFDPAGSSLEQTLRVADGSLYDAKRRR